MNSTNPTTHTNPAMRPGSCVSVVFSVLGCLLLFAYGTKSYLSGLSGYGLSLIAFGVCTLANLIYYQLYGNWQLFKSYITVGFTSLYMFLLATGGEQNTGLLWCYSYPLCIFTLVGLREGRRIMLVVLAITALILFFPELIWATHSYTENTKIRFAGSIVFVSLISYLMERSRMIAKHESDEAHDHMREIARRDELTGMLNRRGIKQKVQLELHRVARDRTELSLVLCDIDWFKKINDQYGHDVGDAALKHIAKVLE